MAREMWIGGSNENPVSISEGAHEIGQQFFGAADCEVREEKHGSLRTVDLRKIGKCRINSVETLSDDSAIRRIGPQPIGAGRPRKRENESLTALDVVEVGDMGHRSSGDNTSTMLLRSRKS